MICFICDPFAPQQIILFPEIHACSSFLFRSKLTDLAGADYQAMNTELESLVRQNAGFIDVKGYTSEDGERLTVVWWRDEESLRDWRELMRHRQAQQTGRAKWYQYYEMEVANVIRTSSFARAAR